MVVAGSDAACRHWVWLLVHACVARLRYGYRVDHRACPFRGVFGRGDRGRPRLATQIGASARSLAILEDRRDRLFVCGRRRDA